MVTYDFAIRGATIIDGSGNEPFEGDVAIVGRTIVAVGAAPGEAREEIDGRGLVVTPGFVDIHTHYDAQVTWSSHLLPSSTHGVTSVVMGNCAIGVAPCRPEDRATLVRVIAGVEDLPEPVLAEGVPWAWETFPEYMAFLRGRQTDVDVAAQVAHSAVRVYVMGKRGADREAARAQDLAEMRKIVREGMEAGAIGVSTSHTMVHRTLDGVLAPAETAAEDELHALAAGLRDFGDGVFQLICDFNDVTRDGSVSFDMMKRIARSCGRPLSYTLLQRPDDVDEGWDMLLDLVAEANAEGVKITSQVAPRGTGLLFGLDLSINPFSFCASYQAIADLPLKDRVARMRDPQLRQQIISETPAGDNPGSVYITTLVESMFELGDPPNYEPAAEAFLGPRAQAMGVDPRALAYDLLLKNDGRNMLYLALVNYADRNFDAVRKMMLHPNSVVALGDGGAHLGYICDAGYTTFMLTYWARERSRDRLSLPWIVQALTSRPAETVGLFDRGRIAPGYKADLNLIDLDRLRAYAPRVAYDLPANGRRQVATAVSAKIGVATFPEYVEWLKAGPPERRRLGTSASDSYLKIYGMMIGRDLGVSLETVPHRGAAPLVVALKAGTLPAGLGSVTALLQHSLGIRVKILATSGSKRVSVLRGVPTAVELGYPNLELDEWYGFFASSSSPGPILAAWNRQLRAVLAEDEVVAALARLGLDVETSTQEEAAARLASHQQAWKARMESFGMKPAD